jgi:sugar-specific transcriptional regulator TrmB
MNTKDLKQLGLTSKEAALYCVLVKHGPSEASELARRVQIPRTTVYDLAERLREKGLMSKTTRRGETLFVAEDPRFLFQRHSFLSSLAKRLADEFTKSEERRVSKPHISYFEGVRGLREIFEKTLLHRNLTMYQIVSTKDMLETLGTAFMKKYIKLRAARNIKNKAIIIPEGNIDDKKYGYSSHTDSKYLRESRLGPKGMGPIAMFMIYDDNVAIVSTERENFGFIVHSSDFATLMKGIFNVLWNISSPV